MPTVFIYRLIWYNETMATIHKESLQRIIALYKQGYSAREIAEQLGVPLDAVYYFFRKYHIVRRTPKENSALQFQKKLPSFQVKEKRTPEEEVLRIAGTMLYWGEGSKWSGEVIVDFANSDPTMIKIFLAFLRRICGVDEKKLRVFLYCYENQDPEKLISFWKQCTKISARQFTKPYIRKDFQISKTGKMKYGLVHIRYGDKKLLMLIRNWIDEFVRMYAGNL